MSASLIKSVEGKLDELLTLCAHLEKENAALKGQQQLWQQERKRLMEKNDIARTRVEAMIQHLKALESES